MRGSSVALGVALASACDNATAAGRTVDAVVISGLVDAASLLGIARRSVGSAPVALYLHENQLLYPRAPGQRHDDDPALANWRSVEAAEVVWFNSAFHRDALFVAIDELLDRQPEPVARQRLEARHVDSQVLWPGVEAVQLIDGSRSPRQMPTVLWNQRWDHDKNPRSVMAALDACARDGLPFELIIAGDDQHNASTEIAELLPALERRIVHRGHLPSDRYSEVLLRSDVVVSAADHEFFGIAVVEAIAAGAIPVLPDRLSFPELVPERWHEPVLYEQGQLRTAVARVLANVDAARDATKGLRDTMRRFDVVEAAARHDAAVDSLLHRVHRV